MRIAIQDSWPNLPGNAEHEFIARFKIACGKVGAECASVVTSDDLIAFDADVVLVSHEFSRKVTSVPTVGLLWSPLSFFDEDTYRVQSILSYDGYLAGNKTIATYLRDLQAGVTTRKPIGAELFLPTSYTTDIHALETGTEPSLCYVGVHWDGARHRDLFETLSQRRMITCYGPEQSWRHLPDSYGGFLPFDGTSVIETIGRHGMALCLHKAEHRIENTPSMRLFEALSVGAVPICDDIQFARDNLSDFATFVDTTQPARRVSDEIAAAMDQVRNQPDAARERARKAKTWFDLNWSLEAKIRNLIIPFVEEVGRVGRFARNRRDGTGPVAVKAPGGLFARKRAEAPAPQCEIVMRSGGRDLAYARRAIASVKAANSAEFALGMVVVDYKGRADLETLCAELAGPDFPIRYVRSPTTGFRSTALWDGLKAVRAPFVAHIDDDDSVFENHYRQLAAAFEGPGEIKVAYTGVVRIEDEPGNYVTAPNYDGPLGKVIEERRELKFLDLFDLERLARFDNFIQSNTWMARTPFVQAILKEDPELIVVEDVYLYLLMAAHGPFAFTGSPTALWHWRSSTNDNSMLMVDEAIWLDTIERIKLRLATIPFRQTTTFHSLRNPGDVERIRQRLTPVPFGQTTTFNHLLDQTGDGKGKARRRRAGVPPQLNFGHAIEGGLAFKENSIIEGFHTPEIGGIWSKDKEATILISLAPQVREQGGTVVVECLGSMGDAADRWIEVELIGGPSERVPVTDWSLKTVRLPLAADAESPMILRVTTSHLIKPDGSGETRMLGACVQTLRVLAAAADEEVDPALAQVPSLPSLLAVPFTGGFARVALDAHKRGAMLIQTSQPGRAFIGDGADMVSILSSRNGQFPISKRLAASSDWFVFKANDPDSEGEVRLHEADETQASAWLTLNADALAVLRDYRSIDDGAYQHVAATLTGSKLIESAQPLYLLIQRRNGEGWWEVRPSFGAAWDALYDLGEETSDDAGRVRHGRIRDIAPNLTTTPGVEGADRSNIVAAAILRSILVGAVDAIALRQGDAPDAFLFWLIEELLVVG